MAEKKNHKMQSEKQFKGQFKMQPSKVLKRSFIAKSLIYLKQQYGVRVRKLPISMIHYVTDKCNAKCEHCFYWKSLGGKYEPSLEEIEKLVKGMPKLNSVSLTGGEPFLREDIVDVALIWAKKADRISIPTNGLLTERIVKDVREILDKTKDMGTSVSVRVSLDGLKRLHDKTRGVKIFDKAVKTLKELSKIESSRFAFGTLTVISNQNYKDIEKIGQFVQERVGANCFFEFIRGEPRSKSYMLPPMKDIGKVMESVKKIYSRNKKDETLVMLGNKFLEAEAETIKKNKRIVSCLAGKSSGVIYTNGDIAICEMFKPFANLRKNDWKFRKVWFSRGADEERKKARKCFCYHGCWMFQNIALSARIIPDLVGSEVKKRFALS